MINLHKNGGQNNGPFDDQTNPHDQNTGLVQYLDPHCILVFLPQIEMVPVFSNFLRLMECGMDPIVLMDGSFETAKKPTLYSRAKDQARTSVACFPSTHHKNIVLPMFAKGNDNCFFCNQFFLSFWK